jgi:Ca-activated chloride channel family protein
MYAEQPVKKLPGAVLLATIATLELSAYATQPTFKASVDLVPIRATVRDGRGRLVTTLTQSDFEILDNGERRRILDFQTDTTSPVTIALLVDVSGSMRVGPKLAFANEVVKRITDGLLSGHDEAALFTFDADLREERPFTDQPASLVGALTALEPFGHTALYDAIAETARRIESRQAERRAIVVITDGLDTASKLTPPEVSGLASSIDVPVYVVVAVPSVDVQIQTERTEKRSADLQELSAWTGGDLFWVTAPVSAGTGARQILTELRHQYLIAIESAPQGDWHPIDVRVRSRGMTVRARSGYFGRTRSISQ